MSNLNVFVIGGSRNIGYFTSVRLLDAGATVTFLLRSPSVFDNDETIQKYVSAGKAKLVKGDALVEDDCRRGWNTASSNAQVDYLLTTVGGLPNFSLSRGLYLDPPNLVAQSFLNIMSTMPPNVKVITVSSSGLTKSSHASVPFVLKPFYGAALAAPHKDKLGMERAIAHFTGSQWDAKDGEPSEEILEKDWKSRSGLPAAGSFHDIVVVRPALLTSGESLADKYAEKYNEKPDKKQKPAYRTSTEELGGYTVSRQDVAHFIAGIVLRDWSQWQGKIVNIAY